ncbi:hypothetical protein [Mycobacterium sp.]|jgi:hypothetical protein|uniref:hypothetical protein n=1 Tax=Mycobacterium sp. TaxID=1785 RepID=UPI002D60094A|nr:hypothetical protein [Mycobacterium sp.]HZA11822.1 hypothetical protein [Mycobacterium sp.]
MGAADDHRVTGLAGRDHRARQPLARVGALAGLAAAIAAIGIGAVMLLMTPGSTPRPAPTIQQITVARLPAIPLSGPEIAALVRRPPDYGALADPQRRASCLSGLGYPISAPILGAKAVHVGGQPAVLLVLAADTPNDLVALAVRADCNSAETGLIAQTQVAPP